MEPITARSDLSDVSVDDIRSVSSTGPDSFGGPGIEIVDQVYRCAVPDASIAATASVESALTSVSLESRQISRASSRVSIAAIPFLSPRQAPYIGGPATPRPQSIVLTHAHAGPKERELLQAIIDNQDNIAASLILASDCIIASDALFTLIFHQMKRYLTADQKILAIKLLLFCQHWVDANKDTHAFQIAKPKIAEIIEYAKTQTEVSAVQTQAHRLEQAFSEQTVRRVSAPETVHVHTAENFDQILQDLRKDRLRGRYNDTVKKVAYDLTEKQIQLFCQISPRHMISEKWQALPACVQQFTSYFDLVSLYFSDLIVLDPDVDKRVDIIKFLLDISKECIALNNYSTLASCASALNCASVGRLNDTWKKVLSERSYREQKDEIDSLFSGLGSFRELRYYMQRQSPSIPCFSVLMQDMVSFQEVPQCTADQRFNFEKLKHVEACLDTFFKEQDRWRLARRRDFHTTIDDCITRHVALTEDLRYERSLQIEATRRASVSSASMSSNLSVASSSSISDQQL